jgi:F1F0 ATPase subunit 2
LVSLLMRTSIVLAGFYFIAHGHWERLLICLFGFVVARPIVLGFTRAAEKSTHVARETSHAS